MFFVSITKKVGLVVPFKIWPIDASSFSLTFKPLINKN